MPPHPRSKATLRREQFEAGTLPPVCVVSGEPATVITRRTAESPVGLTYLAILLGVVSYVVIRAITVKRLDGGLPYSPEAARRDPAFVERRRNLLIAATASAVTATIAILVARSNLVDAHGSPRLLIWLAGIALVGATLVLIALAARRPITWVATVFDHQRTGDVLVTHLHPGFVEALAATPLATSAAVNAPPPPAGWFPDPTGIAAQRYWDGQAWSDRIQG